MGDQFKWQFNESNSAEDSEQADPGPRSSTATFWILALAAVAIIIGAWAFLRHQQDQNQQAQIDTAQTVVDLLTGAVRSGDGELFYALQENEPAWFAAQLQPINLDLFRAAPVVTNVQQPEQVLQTNVRWSERDQSFQRVLFLAPRGGQLQQIATDAAYWGDSRELSQPWGQLVYTQVDEPYAPLIASYAAGRIDAICSEGCLPDRLPLTLQLSAEFDQTAASGQINVPSPRLVALDDTAEPADPFWRLLDERLIDYLTPATIRFAVADVRFPRFDYDRAAEAFNAANPDIQVEIVRVRDAPATAREMIGLDGAAFLPPIELIAAGQVHDLTPYMTSDPDFDGKDFYEQIWQAGLWRDRLWALPQAAQMPLIFYHRDAYQSAELEEPLIGWTWTEMADDAGALVGAEIVTGNELTWGYLDQSFDSLYSFAYGQQSECGALERRPCPLPLSEEEIAAALTWYFEMTESGVLPDVSLIPAQERYRLLINSFFKTAIWVDEPVFYEHRTMLFPMGVLPLPGSDQFESSTPLWVQGSFINAQSSRPLATWRWLKFLSYWPPKPTYRLIPARPSVGEETAFWGGLPRELAEPMRVAFPLARPIRLSERTIFNWPTIRAVTEGRQTPREAARSALDFAWFGVVSD